LPCDFAKGKKNINIKKMKKLIFSVVFLVLFAANSFAGTIVITAYGNKTGPTTVDSKGNTTFNCDNELDPICGKVSVQSSSQTEVPNQGDPTTVTTFMNGQQDAQYSGGYISVDSQLEQDGSTTYSVALSDIQQD